MPFACSCVAFIPVFMKLLCSECQVSSVVWNQSLALFCTKLQQLRCPFRLFKCFFSIVQWPGNGVKPSLSFCDTHSSVIRSELKNYLFLIQGPDRICSKEIINSRCAARMVQWSSFMPKWVQKTLPHFIKFCPKKHKRKKLFMFSDILCR